MAALVAGSSFVSYINASQVAVPALVEGVNGTVLALFVFDPSGYFHAAAVSFSAAHTRGTWDYATVPVTEGAFNATSAAAYTLGAESGLLVDSTAADAVVNLPDASLCKGRTYFVKKKVADNTVTITPHGDDPIDARSDIELANIWAAATVVSTGAGWVIQSEFTGTPPD